MQGSVEAGEYWVCDAEDADAIILPNIVALWKLRWRHANTMVTLFESLERNHPGESYYYTASGVGPADRRCIVNMYGNSLPKGNVEYKHTARDWIPIWTDIAERLLNKVREANKTLKEFKELTGRKI